MSAAVMTFEPWYVEYHKTMAVASAVGNAVKRQVGILGLAKDFWTVARTYRSLLRDLEKVESIRSEELCSAIAKLQELYNTVDRVLSEARRKGLANRTLTNGSIQSIRTSNSTLQDFIERLELAADPSVATAALETLEEYKRGETVGLESLL